MTPRQRKLLVKGAVLAFLVIVIFLLSRYGPQPLAVLELFGDELGEVEDFYSSRARIKRFLISLGPYSSAVFILLQALQVLFSPIPGELTGVVGGYVYGRGFGFILSTLGLTLGSWLAFELARVLGRPFVERFVKGAVLDKFHFLATKIGAVICLGLFALPGLPKDSLCYVLGLSRMRLRSFLVVVIIGRMPGTYLLTMQGDSIRSRDYTTALAIAAICAAIFFIAYFYRTGLSHWVKNSMGTKSRGE